MPPSAQDLQYMQQALDQALKALYITSPNPRVGCVIVSPSGMIIGEGHTQIAGGPHAEIVALENTRKRGFDTKGSTVYVTLEPCSHTGRTPPCTNALIAAGVKRVVASLEDPNPLVCGKGFAALRDADIEVEVGLLSDEAIQINAGFIKRMTESRPFVRLKVACSVDGATALLNGKSQWITGDLARADGHAWRARSCAVLTGIGTLLSDNPTLNVRGIGTPRQPKAVVIDAKLDTPLGAAIFSEPSREVLIYCAQAQREKKEALTQRGATVIEIPSSAQRERVDLKEMLKDLAQRQINELHIEAGAGLNASFIKGGLVDEYIIYQAPIVVGPSKGWAQLSALENLEDCSHLRFIETKFIGEDLFIRARPVQSGSP